MRTISPRIAHQFALVIRAVLLTSLAVFPYAFMTSPGHAKGENKQIQTGNGKKTKARADALRRTKGSPGPNLPNLAALRDAPVVQPQALPPIPSNRRCFDCDERNALIDTFSVARTDLRNRTGRVGVDPLSQNYHWSLPLVGLKGRGASTLMWPSSMTH